MTDNTSTPNTDGAPANAGVPYQDLCEHAGVALIATDAELGITLWNRSATQLFGASRQQMVGASLLTLIPAGRREGLRRLLFEVLERQTRREFQFPQRDIAGEHRYLAASVAPMVGRDAEATGLSICVTDITRFTERLRKAGVGHKMSALGEMAGALAHHFNNILGGLVTGVDFALASDNPHLEHRALEQAARSLARATQLMDHLLAFAEGDHRNRDLGDLTEVVLQAVDLVEPELDSSEVKLELNLHVLPVVAVPRHQFLTVIFNLVRNAIDSMPDGGTLRIDVRHVGERCELSFADTGQGIPADKLDRIFEPFFSTKDAKPGDERAIGLGLAVVHGFLQEIGGSISVESTKGKGSVFQVEIPVREDPLRLGPLPARPGG